MVAEASALVVSVSARKASGEWIAPEARPGALTPTTALKLMGQLTKGKRSTFACVNGYAHVTVLRSNKGGHMRIWKATKGPYCLFHTS